jgi:hypothetical protein
MSIVAGADADDDARLNGRTGFDDSADFVDFVGSAAGAAGTVAARLARLALPIGRRSSCRSRHGGR